jgi:2,5-furandicarboxylate decarboxylase 1
MPEDMRTWINQLEKAGELARVSEEVNLEYQMAERLGSAREKAPLFDNIKGHPGWKVLGTAPANMRQVALAFNTEPSRVNIEYARRIDKGLVKCRMVSSGPVKDRVFKGADVRLTDLPVHVQGQRDSGPFITTGICITKDPDTGVRNIALHRLQVKGDNKTGILMLPQRHTWLIYKKYEAVNQPMPIAIMIGHHPMYYFASTIRDTFDLDELEIAGSLLEEPVDLVKCETIDLEAPAYSEIVLEGEVPPGVRENEGPFSEFQNYYAEERENPLINIKAITMRRDAIYKALQHAPPNEGILYGTVPMASSLMRDLRNVGGYVDLHDVSCIWGNSMFGAVIQMTPRLYGEAKQVLMAAMSSFYMHQKVVIAVDKDVDIYDPQDVAWAVTTRVDPANDVVIIPGVHGHGLDISSPEVNSPGLTQWQRIGSRMLIDATKPPNTDPEARAVFERSRPPLPH